MDGRLSILGLYEWDSTIFDGMELPKKPFSMPYEDLYIEALPIEKDTLVFSLITELSQFSVAYPNPDMMKRAITAWSRRNVWSWQKLYESYFYKYNPLWNKDGKITNTDTETRDLATTNTNGNTRTLNTRNDHEDTETENATRTDNLTRTDDFRTSDNETVTYGGTSNTVDHAENISDRSVNAFNGGLELAERNEDTGDATSETTRGGSDTTEGTGTNSGTSKNTGTQTNAGTKNSTGNSRDTGTITDSGSGSGTDTGTVKHEYDSYERGNIGVTMTQQLIEADRELYRNNIYDIIIRDFKKEFCILVY